MLLVTGEPEMAHILVNGISAKSGGGRSVLTNFLTVLGERSGGHAYTVLVPSAAGYSNFAARLVRIIAMPIGSSTAMLPFTNRFVLPSLVRKLGCDAILTFSDLPIPSPIPQVYLFDWPYAAYPDSPAWRMGGIAAVAKRRVKLHTFRKLLPWIDVFVAQGSAIGERMRDLYGLGRIAVVPNAVSVDNLRGEMKRDFLLPPGFKFLCLSHYYSHKNLELLVEVAERIRSEGVDWKIVITIDRHQGRGARRLLRSVERKGLCGVVLNVGSVTMAEVPSLYRQTQALLLPSLLESFSGTYVEAMHHGKPIFTSHYDFATDVCGEGAFYFDPLDPDDVWRVLQAGVTRPDLMANKVAAARVRLAGMPGWHSTFNSYISLVESALRPEPGRALHE